MNAPWDFHYAPVAKLVTASGGDASGTDVIIACARRTGETRIAEAVASVCPEHHVSRIVSRAPLFWYRLQAPVEADPRAIARRLSEAGIAVRYVAPARSGSYVVAPPLDLDAPPARASSSWSARPSRGHPAVHTPGRWFLRDGAGGVAVDRMRLRHGAGVRLAVIDDDAMAAELVPLDAEILVGIDWAPRAQMHGALMVAWAVGTKSGFDGVAPDTSPRLYLVPKPGVDVVSLPLAIVRAVLDGADVIVCATYVEGTTSPMLDDALELAVRFGRRGRGTAVVMPTGREASSAGNSLHASWSLGAGDPASDPRVFCIGPRSARGGWFFWKDHRGKFAPFANRGPAVRWLAPGDDLAFPFTAIERMCHAESSGASAIAAGVLCLVLAENPELTLREVDSVVTRTLSPVSPGIDPAHEPLADAEDARPLVTDRDGHNAKNGYGAMHALRACVSVMDPVAAALVAVGHDGAALRWLDAVRLCNVAWPCSPKATRWLARAIVRDAETWHAARAIVRHARLVLHPGRAEAHGIGAWTRQLALLVRRLEWAARRTRHAAELGALREQLEEILESQERAAAFEAELVRIAKLVIGGPEFQHDRDEAPETSRSSSAVQRTTCADAPTTL